MPGLKYIKFFAHPLFLAGILVSASAPFTLNLYPKYKAKVTQTSTFGRPNTRVLWVDLDNNGESEKMEWFINSEGKAAYKTTSQSGYILDQQVFNGQSLTLRNPPILRDLNHNNLPEIYAFYHRNDSLFNRGIEYTDGKPHIIVRERLIITIANPKGDYDYGVSGSLSNELENDASEELVFCVNAGYPVRPRCIFKFNPFTDNLIHSAFLGAVSNVKGQINPEETGHRKYLIVQNAPGNLRDSLINGLNDLYVRLVVLDDKLQTVWESGQLGSVYSGTDVFPLNSGGKVRIIVLLTNRQAPELTAFLMVYSSDGKLLKSLKLSDPDNNSYSVFLNPDKKDSCFRLLDNGGFLSTYDLSLNEVKKVKVPYLNGSKEFLDIDGDGEKEKIIINDDITILRNDLTHPVKVSILNESALDGNIYLKTNKNRPNEISVQYGNRYSLISYYKFSGYPYRFPGLFVLWGVMAGLIFGIQYLQRLALREKYLNERRISELQLLLMRNQINPHFLFNAINSISYRLMEKNPEEANNNVIRLSRLIQNNLIASDNFSRSLKEELEAAQSYAEIVRSQMEDPFELIVDISPGTDMDIQVPVMVIQNYLENAIKHGVKSMGKDGKISVKISEDGKNLYLTINDNGIGRKKAAAAGQKVPSTGKGTDLMNRFFKEVNKANERKIWVKVDDLTDDKGNPEGTKVSIEIPVNMKYRKYEN